MRSWTSGKLTRSPPRQIQVLNPGGREAPGRIFSNFTPGDPVHPDHRRFVQVTATGVVCTDPFGAAARRKGQVHVYGSDLALHLQDDPRRRSGASRGIGASIAERLAAEGASVVVNYVSSKSGAEAMVNGIAQKGGTAVAIQGDVSRIPDVQRLFAETKKNFGRLDILVNNAGFYEFAPLESIHRNTSKSTSA